MVWAGSAAETVSGRRAGMGGAVHGPVWLLLTAALLSAGLTQATAANGERAGMGEPCIYEGHLRSNKNWYGYLANLTVMTTGRMVFNFQYPADLCCLNILFYSEDQVSILNARMSCWQKEYVLQPEYEQILRLTPRFSWSGCHMTHPNGVPTYVCVGGRSFTSISSAHNRPTTWYVALSHCSSLHGLDLKYRLDIFGHIGECKSGYKVVTTPSLMDSHSPHAEIVSSEAIEKTAQNDVCVLEGDLNVTSTWYGFLTNITLKQGGGFNFDFTYPYSMELENVVLYNEDDIKKLKRDQSCWQKEGIIRSRHVPDQILDLSRRSSWNGCMTKNTTLGKSLSCRGERRYDKRKKIFVAVSNCRSSVGLFLRYRLEIRGFEGNPCSGSSSVHHSNTSPLPGWLAGGLLLPLWGAVGSLPPTTVVCLALSTSFHSLWSLGFSTTVILLIMQILRVCGACRRGLIELLRRLQLVGRSSGHRCHSTPHSLTKAAAISSSNISTRPGLRAREPLLMDYISTASLQNIILNSKWSCGDVRTVVCNLGGGNARPGESIAANSDDSVCMGSVRGRTIPQFSDAPSR